MSEQENRPDGAPAQPPPDEPGLPDETTPGVAATPEETGAAEVPEPRPEAPSEPEKQPEPDVVLDRARVTEVVDPTQIRRAPRFGSFLFVGLFLAALLSGGLSFVRDAFLPAEQVAARALDSWGIFWVLFIFFGAMFALASFAVVAWLDRRSVRRFTQGGGR